MKRRGILSMAAAALAGLALTPPAALAATPGAAQAPAAWQAHFAALDHGAILADRAAQVVHFWSPQGEVYRLYPLLAGQGLRPGETRVIRKIEGPTWRPSSLMRSRDPRLPALVPPGPGNPLGSHALYLAVEGLRIHGVAEDPQARADESIALANAHIAELFGLVRVGAPVRLI